MDHLTGLNKNLLMYTQQTGADQGFFRGGRFFKKI